MPHHTLAVDTSTYTQAVALLRDDDVLAHVRELPEAHHGGQLLGLIDRLLRSRGLRPADLDLLVCGLGPGSFTGLRVGMACLKGLSMTTGRPLVGASTLAALSLPYALARPGEPVASAVDARKKEVYSGSYAWNKAEDALQIVEPERALSPQALRQALEQGGAALLVGFMVGKYAPLRPRAGDRFTIATEPHVAPDAVSLATLGRARFEALGEQSELDALEPNYIRPSDAELNFGHSKRVR